MIDQRLLETFKNPSWRLNNVYSIVDKKTKLRTFKQNIIQKLIYQNPMKRKMILKARQQGVSTGCLIDQFDYTITKFNVTSVILAHEQDSIKKLFRIPMRAYRYMHPTLKPVLDRGGGSKHEMYFPLLNSRIYCDLESRGDTIHKLHVSEMAFIKEQERLLATLQAVPLDGQVTLESTPNGMGNLFYEMWNDPDQPYAKLFFPWYIFPEYAVETQPLILTADELELCEKAQRLFGISLTHEQIAFRRTKQKELGDLFLQEYPEDDQTCFLASGESAFDLFIIKTLMEKRKKPLSDDGKLKVYSKYDKSKRYVVGVDCAEGIDGDYCVASLFESRSRTQAALLRGHWKPYDFAHRINDLCKQYVTGGRPWPLLGIERNNHGHSVLLELEEHIRYSNLYRHTDEKLGWLTDKVTRPICLDTFIEGVENESVHLNDLDTFRECLTLVNEDKKIQAAQGKHDDCILASAIALQMCISDAGSDIYDNIKDRIRV
jgi:hypothetical protein